MKNYFFTRNKSVCAIYLFFFFALLLRFLWLSYPPWPVAIEVMHIESAKNYLSFGSFAPDNWHTPPLKKLLLFLSMEIAGDNPFGWRFLNALLGSLTVLYLGLLGFQLFSKQPFIVYTSAFILAIDPLHITFSRTSFEDIPAAFFLTAAIYYSLNFFESLNKKYLLTALILYALGIAARWYVVFPFLIFFFYFIKQPKIHSIRNNLLTIYYLLNLFMFLPLTIYLLTFLPWFTRGYSLLEWILLQKAMIIAQATVSLERFDYGYLLGYSYQAWQWYLRPIAFGFLSKTFAFANLITVNPFISLLVFPSFIYWHKQHKSSPQKFFFNSFIALYLFFVLSPRPIFIYNSISTLPFTCLTVTSLLFYFKEKFSPIFTYVYLFLIFLLLLYIFPLITGIAAKFSWNYFSFINLLIKMGVPFITGVD